MKRRRFLLAGGSVLTVLTASCSGQQGEGIDPGGFALLSGGGNGAGSSGGMASADDPQGGETDPSTGDDGTTGDETDGAGTGDDSDGGGADDSDGDGTEESDGDGDADEEIPGFSGSTAISEAETDGVEVESVGRDGQRAELRFLTTAADEEELVSDVTTVLEAISAAITDADEFEGTIETFELEVYHEGHEESERLSFDPGTAIDYRNGDISMETYLDRVS